MHGWRVFAGEVGVIVLGVLLALGAQQVVEDINMRSDVRELRRTIDHEIGLNLYVYQVRSLGSACNEKRIKELIAWVEAAREGQALPEIVPSAPSAISPYRSAWDSRDGEVFANVWQTDFLVRIDPTSGEVCGVVDLSGLLPDRRGMNPADDVLNGVAWDPDGRRLFVTGKNWPSLFEIRLTGPH